jgi:hypothetical protein
MGVRRGGLAVVGALLLLVGCRSSSHRMLEMPPGASGSLRVVVAPMNLALPLGPDLADAVDPVRGELIRYLQEHGSRVAVVWSPDASEVWREAEAALAPEGGPAPPVEATAVAFARAVAAESPFDLLVMPSLVYRDARVEGRVAYWDGVHRRIRFTLEPSAVPPTSVQPSEARVEAAPGWRRFRGKITGVTLHALVLSGKGKILFQGFGGLDLVHDVREGKGADESLLRLQSRPLQDAANVREGIAVALDPYLVARAASR